MTDTDRRAIIGAIAAAPALLAAPAQASSAAANLSALDEDALWDAGARSTDREFARLCAEAVLAQARALAVDRQYDNARRSADAATPEFPDALTIPCVLRDLNTGESKRTWTEHWHPKRADPVAPEYSASAPRLDTYARRYAAQRGIPYSRAVETELRAQFEAWEAQREEALARFLVGKLARASDAAWDEASEARWRVLRYPARSSEVLLLKASLRRCEAINAEEPDEIETWTEILADLTRLLAT
jgi:hypothetical protein